MIVIINRDGRFSIDHLLGREGGGVRGESEEGHAYGPSPSPKPLLCP